MLLPGPPRSTNDSGFGENLWTLPDDDAVKVATVAVIVQLPSSPAKTMPSVAPKLQTFRLLEL